VPEFGTLTFLNCLISLNLINIFDIYCFKMRGSAFTGGVGDCQEHSSLDGGDIGGVNGSTQREMVESLVTMGINRKKAELVSHLM